MELGPSKVRLRASDWHLECIPTAHVDGSGPLLPDANQSVVRGIEGHLAPASDEA